MDKRRVCKICEAEFLQPGPGHVRYCSATCRARYQALVAARWYARRAAEDADFKPNRAAKLRAQRGIKLCDIDGCAEPRQPRGNYCSIHGNRTKGGYVVRKVNGVRIVEHRAVMERLLGRTLRPFESVHHRNGIRHDNRPTNLELWTRPQPSGQRPEDLVAWVVEHYRSLVVEALGEPH